MDGGFLASLAFVGLAIAWVAFSLWCATHSPPAEPRRAELQQDRYIGEEPLELPQEVPPSVFPPPGPEADAAPFVIQA